VRAQPVVAQVAPVYLPFVKNGEPLRRMRFAVIGDYGLDGQAEADVARLVKSWKPDFVFTVGDNNYYNGAVSTIDRNIGKYYQEFITPYQGQFGPGAAVNRFYPALGNHDWDGKKGQPYLDYFVLPGNERYYDIAFGVVHLFVLDSDKREPDGVTADSIQGQWLQRQLANSRSCWDVVLMHHAPYSSGLFNGPSEWMQWPYRAWGADVVFAGHDHIYERLLVDGLPYFVDGLGGQSISPFRTPVLGSQVRYNGDYGAMLVTADLSHMTLQFYSRAGQLIDTTSLSKTCR